MKHTKEPWRQGKRPRDDMLFQSGDESQTPIAVFFLDQDRDRTAACVNACAGLNPGAIPEVVEALNWLVHLHMGVSRDGSNNIGEAEWLQAIDEGIAALANLEAES